jgi:hypothetical protein
MGGDGDICGAAIDSVVCLFWVSDGMGGRWSEVVLPLTLTALFALENNCMVANYSV